MAAGGRTGTRRGVSLGQWVGTGLLLAGVLTGQVGVAGLLVATWLENISAGIATLRALLRADRDGGTPRWTPAPAPPPGTHGTDRPVWEAATQPPTEPPAPPPVGPFGTDRPVWGPRPEPADPVASPAVRRADLPPVTDLADLPPGCAAPFFALHFGMFTLGHGVFLAAGGTALAAAGSLGDGSSPSGVGGPLGALVLLLAAVARAARDVEPTHAIKEAYAGVVTLHLAIVVGGVLAGTWLVPAAIAGTAPDLPVSLDVLAALALVALLTVADLVRARVVAHDRSAADAR